MPPELPQDRPSRRARLSRRRLAPFLHTLALAALISAALAPSAFAFAPLRPPLSIEAIAPMVDGALTYLQVNGASQGDAPRGRLATDLYLINDGASTLRIDRVRLAFDQPARPPIILDAGLRLWCPFPYPNEVDPPLDADAGLDLPPDVLCRLSLTPDPLLDLPTSSRVRITVFADGWVLGRSDIQRDLIEYQAPTPTGSFAFPARATDLEDDELWSGSSPAATSERRFGRTDDDAVHAYDLTVVRFDGVDWLDTHPFPVGQTEPLVNDDYLSFGKPVWSMAEGTVVDCVSGQPDNTPTQDFGDTPNFIAIQTGDVVAWYEHLQQDSTPPFFCAPGVVIPENQPLGFVGSSGSERPRLRVRLERAGDPMPLHFDDAFSLAQDQLSASPQVNAPWNALEAEGLAAEPTLVWPAVLRPRDLVDTGIATDLHAIAATSNQRLVTASRMQPSEDPLLILWEADNSGELIARDLDVNAWPAGDLALASPQGTNDAALVLSSANTSQFVVFAYDVVGDSLTETAFQVNNAASRVDVTSAPFAGGIIAAKLALFGGGTLQVQAWHIDAAAGVIEQRDSGHNAATITDLAIARTAAFQGVVTATALTNGNLQLTTFSVENDGFQILLSNVYEDGPVQDVSIAHLGVLPSGDDLVVTACRTDLGNLQAISWAIAPDGSITRLGEMNTVSSGEVSVSRGAPDHAIITITTVGSLITTAWHIAPDGSFEHRLAVVRETGASDAAMTNAGGVLVTDPRLMTMVYSDDADTLRVRRLQVNLIE